MWILVLISVSLALVPMLDNLVEQLQPEIQKAVVRKISSPIARPLPTIETNPREIYEAAEKWQQVIDPTEIQEPLDEVTFTAQDLNILLWLDPSAKKLGQHLSLQLDEQNLFDSLLPVATGNTSLKGEVMVNIKAEKMFVDVCLPLSKLGFSGYGNRFINAYGEIVVDFRNGKIGIFFDPHEIEGNPPSMIVRHQVRNIDIYRYFIKHRTIYGKLADKITHASISNGNVKLKLREAEDSGDIFANSEPLQDPKKKEPPRQTDLLEAQFHSIKRQR